MTNVTIETEPTPYELLRREMEERYPFLNVNKSLLKTREDDMRGKYIRTPLMCQHISEGKRGKSIKSNPKSEEHKRKLSETLKGIVHSEESNRKRSITEKGKIPWNKGRHLSEEDKLHKSLAQRGKPHSPEHTRAAMLAQNIEPNKTESALIELLDVVCPNEYEYTGDGRLIMYGASPDFTNCNGQKKVIELFGDYWHSPEKTGKSYKQEEQDRIDKFAAFGFECLIIWEYELIDIQSVTKKIRAFNQGKENKPRKGELARQGSEGE